jgi:hypothetical protein
MVTIWIFCTRRDAGPTSPSDSVSLLRREELQPYVPTFQDDYYREIFRLRGLEFPQDTVRRPQYFGSLTNDIVYKRLAPGVLEN